MAATHPKTHQVLRPAASQPVVHPRPAGRERSAGKGTLTDRQLSLGRHPRSPDESMHPDGARVGTTCRPKPSTSQPRPTPRSSSPPTLADPAPTWTITCRRSTGTLQPLGLHTRTSRICPCAATGLPSLANRPPTAAAHRHRPATTSPRPFRLPPESPSSVRTRRSPRQRRGLRPEKIRRRPTLPGGHPPSTIGAGGLNCRVRNGNGCIPAAMATGNRALSRSAPRRGKSAGTAMPSLSVP